jgi:hypothetical protein
MVKLAMDTGEAANVEAAEAIFSSYRLAVMVGPEVRRSATHQAALLTIVNTARRSLLGGVEVQGDLDVPLRVPQPGATCLADAVRQLGGMPTRRPHPTAPAIVIGTARAAEREFAIRPTFHGWAGGVVPLGTQPLPEEHEFTPSGILAGALAVAEVFQHLRRSNPAAGRRELGLSLWRPEEPWRSPAGSGPLIDRYPSEAWVIGLGNLGQAYLWVLGLLPYARPADVHLMLQDFDSIAVSNDSTSLLTQCALVGAKKARAMALWAEQRGFRASLMERRFAGNFRIGPDEPAVALCGVDNALARAALEDVGFSRIIEAGLGNGTREFLALRVHTFPASRPARTLWTSTATTEAASLDQPAYRALAHAGVDRCGLTQLAGRTVGAPFVGAVAATLVIAELIRLANGAHRYETIDAHLRSLEHRSVICGDPWPPFNPGATGAVPTT